jgi:hypothetical protein
MPTSRTHITQFLSAIQKLMTTTLYEPPAPFPRTDENDLDRLKNRLLRLALATTEDTAMIVALRRAANEAAALAWLEPHPLLVFPVLFIEKATSDHARIERQHSIRARSASLLQEAA